MLSYKSLSVSYAHPFGSETWQNTLLRMGKALFGKKKPKKHFYKMLKYLFGTVLELHLRVSLTKTLKEEKKMMIDHLVIMGRLKHKNYPDLKSDKVNSV